MHDALMDKETPGLSKAERELIVVATSAANDCLYCVVAHGAIARIRSRDPYLADQVAVDWRKAPLSPADARGARRRRAAGGRPAEVTAGDLAGLREHGLTEDDVWDVGAIVAFFALSNRLAHWAAIPPNEEFFLMGRRAAGLTRRRAGRTRDSPTDTPSSRDTPDTQHLFREFPHRGTTGSAPRHETFPGRVVTPSGADVTNGSSEFVRSAPTDTPTR